MALTDPISQFGIHSLTFRNRTTLEPLGQFRVLGDSAINLSSSSIKLNGGSSDYPWDVQSTNKEATLTASIKEFPDFLFENILGSVVTNTSTSTTGTVEAIANVLNSSIVASTGIATATFKTGEEANLKSGRYVVKATSTTAVDVFIDSNIDSTRGGDLTIVDDLLKITASPLTIVTSTAVEIPNTGIELTGDSGTIGMTVGDTAEFEVAHPHGGVSDIVIGATSDIIPELNVTMWGQLGKGGNYATAEAFKVKATSGLSLPFPEKGFSITEIALDLMYDSAKAKVMDFKIVTAA